MCKNSSKLILKSFVSLCLSFLLLTPLCAMMSDETIDWEKLSITGNPSPGVYEDIMQVRMIDNTLIHPKKLTIEGPNIFVHYHAFEGETHKRSAILKLFNENSLYQIFFMDRLKFRYTLKSYGTPPFLKPPWVVCNGESYEAASRCTT